MKRLALLACALALASAAEGIRIGDADSTRVAEVDLKYYPTIPLWTAAGRPQGLPPRKVATVTLGPEEAIQPALDRGGVVQLTGERYLIETPLRLGAGTVLRGAAGGTTIIHGAEGALIMSGADVGLEDLTFAFADPDKLKERAPLVPGTYANLPGWAGPAAPTVHLQGAESAWLDGVIIRDALSDPLRLDGVKRSTLRGVRLEGCLNRGPGSGRMVVAGGEALLVTGLRVRGLRGIQLEGPLKDSVFVGAALGAGFQFRRGSSLVNLLFEDCHFLLPPGYFWKPFSKDPEPLGPGSAVINCSAYHHGTDAVVSGVLMKPGEPYQIQPTVQRGYFDPATRTYQPTHLVKRMQLETVHPEARARGEEIPVAATLTAVPEGVEPLVLRNNHLVHTFLAGGPLPLTAVDDCASALQKAPVAAGETRTIAGEAVVFAALDASVKARPKPIDPLHAAKMQAKFGVKLVAPTGATIDLLAAVGKKWNRALLLQRVIRLDEPATLSFDTDGSAGCSLKILAGEVPLSPGKRYAFEPGLHPLLLIAKVMRPAPFVRASRLALKVQLELTGKPKVLLVDTPKPQGGRLYPTTADRDPLSGERAGIAAWFAFFGEHRGVPYPAIKQDLQALIDGQPQSLAAAHAAVVLQVIEAAPYDETAEDLSPRQWGELADYYERAGLPERTWGIAKHRHPAKIRTYYPDEEIPR